MATQEQIAEAMNAMQRQIAELASQLAEERHRGASLDRMAQVLDRRTTQQAQQPVARLVDTKTRQTSAAAWKRAWRRASQCGRGRCRTTSSVYSQIFGNREEWAAMTAVPITHQLVEQRFGSEADSTDQVTDMEDKIHQVLVVLMQMAEGEANDIVCNSSGMGLEAWRKLTRRWNLLAGSRLRSLLRLVTSPGRASFTELPGVLERWRNRFRSTGILRTNRDRVETYQRTS